MTAESAEQLWDRWIGRVPFLTLAVATAVAMTVGPAMGVTTPPLRLWAQVVLVVVTAVFLWWCMIARPEIATGERSGRVFWVLRTVLTLSLTLLNPLFCIVAWIGYIDAWDHFKGRGRWGALAVTAAVMALGQSGGVPTGLTWQAALFAGLVVVNLGLAGVFSSYSMSMYEQSHRRAAAIVELEAVNADLERALAENARLQEALVTQAVQAGVHQERQRLAREIHDTIAQSLAGIVAQLQAAHAEPDLAAVRRRVDRATDAAREALVEARRSVMDLAPPQLRDGTLADAVRAVVTAWRTESGVAADVVVAGEPRPLHPEVEAALLRIAQEALSNVRRHAAASRVGVTLTYDDDEVMLDVRDDGVGFDAGLPERTTSFGLRGMRQRADALAGELGVETAVGAGTAVSARLPALARSAA